MVFRKGIILGFALVSFLSSGKAQDAEEQMTDSTALRLVEAGFVNVRSAETEDYQVYTIENDDYKFQVDGFSIARRIIEQSAGAKPVKVIGTYYNVPELTMTYSPETGSWKSTKKLDSSWKAVYGKTKLNSNFGKVNIVVYPQVSLMNLIITQIYQSLWQLSPALEFSLWPGMKFSYQLKIPVINDGFGVLEGKVHPGIVSLSQRFRDPWNLNIYGKLTFGSFTNNRFGAALEMRYYLPNERFWVDTQSAFLGNSYFDGFRFNYDPRFHFYWNVAGNFFWPELQTQFTARLQRFLYGDLGVKCEMIKHTRRASIGLYAEKSKGANFNVGFRFQIALPPYRQKRHGYVPKITTSANMGMTYNAGNERLYYREYRTEASDNIMSNNAFNPYYIDYQLR